MSKVVIFDIFGTLIDGNKEKCFPIKRNGVIDFMSQNSGKKFTLYTDADRNNYSEKIKTALEEMSVYSKLSKPHFYSDSMYKGCKNMESVAKEFNVELEDLVLIGDSSRDLKSAMEYATKIIIIPNLSNSHGTDFSFKELGDIDKILEGNSAVCIEWLFGKFIARKGGYSIVHTEF